MNTATWMYAMDSIEDSLIEESAVVTPVNKRFLMIDLHRVVKIAIICTCITICVVSLGILVKHTKQSKKQKNESPSTSVDEIEGTEYLIYAATSNDTETALANAQIGTVSLSTLLQKALQDCGDADNVFAVEVLTKPQTDRNRLCRELLSDVDFDESNFLQTGIIFLKKHQIESLQCPEDIAVLLNLAEKP